MTNVKLQSEYPHLDKYITQIGTIFYFKKDTQIYHNPYGPAVICKDGLKYYYLNGKLHRLDDPAKIYPDGTGRYFINDIFIAFSKQEFYTNIKNLKTITINNQHKSIILNIKNSLSHNLDPSSLNILKSL